MLQIYLVVTGSLVVLVAETFGFDSYENKADTHHGILMVNFYYFISLYFMYININIFLFFWDGSLSFPIDRYFHSTVPLASWHHRACAIWNWQVQVVNGRQFLVPSQQSLPIDRYFYVLTSSHTQVQVVNGRQFLVANQPLIPQCKHPPNILTVRISNVYNLQLF